MRLLTKHLYLHVGGLSFGSRAQIHSISGPCKLALGSPNMSEPTRLRARKNVEYVAPAYADETSSGVCPTTGLAEQVMQTDMDHDTRSGVHAIERARVTGSRRRCQYTDPPV
jgi:hypothetical protein